MGQRQRLEQTAHLRGLDQAAAGGFDRLGLIGGLARAELPRALRQSQRRKEIALRHRPPGARPGLRCGNGQRREIDMGGEIGAARVFERVEMPVFETAWKLSPGALGK